MNAHEAINAVWQELQQPTTCMHLDTLSQEVLESLPPHVQNALTTLAIAELRAINIVFEAWRTTRAAQN